MAHLISLNPMPPGSYWVDVPPNHVTAFSTWSSAATAAGVLRVAATHTYPNGGVWVRFDVFTPGVKWLDVPFLPYIAGPNDMTPEATHGPVTSPQEPSLMQRAESALEHGLETVDLVAGVVLVIALLHYLRSDR